MKKVILLFLAFASYSGATAQSGSQFGVKGGGNLSDASGDDVEGVDPKLSFYAGVFGNFAITDMFYLQPEVLYSGQGWKESGDNINLSYINVPVLAQYRSDNGFYVEAGPQVGFLMAAKVKSGSNSTDIKDALKPIDFSVAGGFGYIFPVNLGINLRYTYGLSNLLDAGGTKARNNVLSLGVSFAFGGN